MSEFPVLESMGIQNPREIARYVVHTTDDADTLRIVYDRKKGSILPVSRKYKFPRIKKSTMVDSGTRETQVIFESSPEFRNALSELYKLMDERESHDEVRKLITEEVKALEEDVAARISYIHSLIDKV